MLALSDLRSLARRYRGGTPGTHDQSATGSTAPTRQDEENYGFPGAGTHGTHGTRESHEPYAVADEHAAFWLTCRAIREEVALAEVGGRLVVGAGADAAFRAALAANEAEVLRLLRGDDPRPLPDEMCDAQWMRPPSCVPDKTGKKHTGPATP